MDKLMSIVLKSALILALAFPGLTAVSQPPLYKVKKIWDQAPHNAFTDLIRFNGKFYCVFREATEHYNTKGLANGKIRVIESKDGHAWKSFALIEKPGFDLRDPDLAITSDKRLMLVTGAAKYSDGRIWSRDSHVAFLDNATQRFSRLIPVTYSPDVDASMDNPNMKWMWRVKWYKNRAYGVIYEEFDKEGKPLINNRLSLVSAPDGIHYSLVKAFDIPGKTDETALRFRPDGELYLLIRMESQPPNQNGILAKSAPPYKDWQMVNTGVKIGGPNLIFYNKGDILIGTRTYSPTEMHTALFGNDATGKFKQLIELPSGGDGSYPGMVLYKDTLYMSYYSSHEGKTSIYFAEIPMREVRRLTGPGPVSPFK